MIMELQEKLNKRDEDVYAHEFTAAQMNYELENLLMINEM